MPVSVCDSGGQGDVGLSMLDCCGSGCLERGIVVSHGMESKVGVDGHGYRRILLFVVRGNSFFLGQRKFAVGFSFGMVGFGVRVSFDAKCRKPFVGRVVVVGLFDANGFGDRATDGILGWVACALPCDG